MLIGLCADCRQRRLMFRRGRCRPCARKRRREARGIFVWANRNIISLKGVQR